MRRSLATLLHTLTAGGPTLLALAATGVLAGCGGPGGIDRSTLNYYYTYDPRSLDPALSSDVPTGEVVSMLFDHLTILDADGKLHPGLAERWESDSTGRVYTFHIRRGATFHDGRPITAKDVEASWIRALTAQGGDPAPLLTIRGAGAVASGDAKRLAGLRVPDDSTVVVTLEQPLNIFPTLAAMPVTAIVPTPTPPGFDQAPVGSGPWRFVSWAHDDQLVFAKNPTYWAGPPKADTLRIRIIPEPLTQAAEYEAGRLSVVEIPFGETLRWEQSSPEQIQRRPALRALYVAVNTTRGPLKDARVRRALNHAVDAGTILKTVMSNRGVRAAGAIPPGIMGYDSTRAPYAWDTAQARRLLREAGYPNGFRLQLWRTQRPELARIAQAIQADLALVGIRAEIVERDASSARAASRKGETDLFLTDWYADYPDPESFTYPLFHSSARGRSNRAHFGDPQLDLFLDRARATTDTALKATLYREIDAMAFEAAPWIFLWFPVDMWAARPELEGWRVPAIFYAQRWTEARYAPEED
jgi:ABC-type transport system substrate-binding protein